MNSFSGKTILIVEDDISTREMIRAALEDFGLSILSEATLAGAMEALKKGKPDLIILDIGLPDGNGLELCLFARGEEGFSKVPVIALTGRTELHDKKKGFDAGVDQYLEKPIVIEELAMWVKALFRRVEMDLHGGSMLTFGDMSICAESFVVSFRGNTVGNLTRREFDLFYFLVKSSPKVLSRDAIISEVWKTAAVPNLVDTHIFNMRRKLPRELAARVQSVPGKGFRYFQPGGQASESK